MVDEYNHIVASVGELWESREIIMNKNQMIPLPGTFQGNHIVTVLNKH